MSRLSIAAGIVFVGLICSPATAQDPPAVIELYGNGVHAYYARQNFKAYELLTQVISSDTKDPRAYYFRAMTLMRIGRESEARADMELGARLEATDADGTYPVARSLERVQGRNRRMLEKYRRQARFGALQQRQSIQRLKYETTRQHEADVLRKQVQLGIEDVTPTDATPTGVGSTVGTPADGAAPQEPAQLPASSESGVTHEAPATDLFQPAAPEGVAPRDTGSTLEEMADPFGELPDGAGDETGPAKSTDVTPPNDGVMVDDPFGESGPLDESTTPADAAEETGPADSTDALPANDADPFGESTAPAAEETTPVEPATPTDDSAGVIVGEKVKGKKLIGILGGLLGKAIGKPLENMAGNASDKLRGPGMGPGPMGPGPGMEPGMPPGMGPSIEPGDPTDGDQFGPATPVPGDDSFNEGTEDGDSEDPFGDDPFGDDPFGANPSEEGPSDDRIPADDSVPDSPFDI